MKILLRRDKLVLTYFNGLEIHPCLLSCIICLRATESAYNGKTTN